MYAKYQNVIAFLAQVVTNQINQEAQASHAPTLASRVRDFTKMNPPEFYGSKMEEYPQEFIDEIYKVLVIIGVNSEDKVGLVAYQLKGLVQIGLLNES